MMHYSLRKFVLAPWCSHGKLLNSAYYFHDRLFIRLAIIIKVLATIATRLLFIVRWLKKGRSIHKCMIQPGDISCTWWAWVFLWSQEGENVCWEWWWVDRRDLEKLNDRQDLRSAMWQYTSSICCQLVWVFHFREAPSSINIAHKRKCSLPWGYDIINTSTLLPNSISNTIQWAHCLLFSHTVRLVACSLSFDFKADLIFVSQFSFVFPSGIHLLFSRRPPPQWSSRNSKAFFKIVQSLVRFPSFTTTLKLYALFLIVAFYDQRSPRSSMSNIPRQPI